MRIYSQNYQWKTSRRKKNQERGEAEVKLLTGKWLCSCSTPPTPPPPPAWSLPTVGYTVASRAVGGRQSHCIDCQVSLYDCRRPHATVPQGRLDMLCWTPSLHTAIYFSSSLISAPPPSVNITASPSSPLYLSYLLQSTASFALFGSLALHWSRRAERLYNRLHQLPRPRN